MKLNSAVRESIGPVLQLRDAGFNTRQISEKIGRSKSFIDRMMNNLPSILGQLAQEKPA